MQDLGYGKDYKYAHDYEDHFVEQEHLPKELLGKRYYAPSESGQEKQIKERLKRMEGKKEELKTLARPVPRYLQLRVAIAIL